MKHFSAQYIITNDGPPLKRGIITTDDDGKILNVEKTGGSLPEKHSISFFNGIIVPGFINCHCHLELSYMKGKIPQGTGLGGFLSELTGIRSAFTGDPVRAIETADRQMSDEGVVACADICNSTHTFHVKKKSGIKYINLLEVFGIDPDAADRRMVEVQKVARAAGENNMEWYIVPHSVYSVSQPLFRLILKESSRNKVTSIHFMESEDERQLIGSGSGQLMEAYRKILPPGAEILPVSDHVTAITDEITPSGNLVLVHNTFIRGDDIDGLRKRRNLYFCLCPGSNRFISNSLPPLDLLKRENCDIVIGTDSLSSNTAISILNEMRILQEEFPGTTLEEIVRWATINGARALSLENSLGIIKAGATPGLVLIRDLDLSELKLTPATRSVRLI